MAVPQERAFEVFTAQLGKWWRKEYSIGEADMADFVMEPKVGGRWYEVGVDGKGVYGTVDHLQVWSFCLERFAKHAAV